MDGVTGVVTLVDDGGFYFESGAIAPGSSGLRVVADAVDLVPGDCVVVDGDVEEQRDEARSEPETTLIAARVRRVLRGAVLPAPSVLTAAFGRDASSVEMRERFEAMEGMRVAVDDGAVIGPTTRDGFALAVDDSIGPRTVRGGRLAEGPLHADVLLVESAVDVDVGDLLAGRLEAIVVPRDGRYWLRPSAPLPPVARSGAPPEQVMVSPGSSPSLATMNVQRLGTAAARVDRVASLIATRLAGPAVVALQEVAAPAAAVLSRLAAAIRSLGGPMYHWHVRADQAGPIASAVLVDPTRAVVMAVLRGGDEADESAFEGSRLPIGLDLCLEGRRLRVVALHLTSKVGDDPLLGSRQPPASPSGARRAEQARWVAGFASEAARRGDGVIVLGDLNDTPESATLAELARGGLVDIMMQLHPSERYSYVYRGSSQLLDYVLADAIASRGAVVDVVHGEADVAASRRAVDHDAVVAWLAPSIGSSCP